MRIKNVEVYGYSELTEPARERARNDLLASGIYPPDDWADDRLAEIRDIADILGFHIDRGPWYDLGRADIFNFVGSFSANPDWKVDLSDSAYWDSNFAREFERLFAQLPRGVAFNIDRNFVELFDEDVSEDAAVDLYRFFQEWALRALREEYDRFFDHETLDMYLEPYEYFETGRMVDF